MIDTHCHLDMCEDGSLERARELGLSRIATVGMNPESWQRALGLAGANDDVYAIVGVHPNEAAGYSDEWIEQVRERALGDKVVAIGETGLDYYRDYAPKEDQQRSFDAHLELASDLGLPIVIHTRQAEADTFDALRDFGGTVILHCFSSPDRIEECIERGYVCSFAGNVTYAKSHDLQRAAKRVPDELLLVETDAPFLSPQPVRGKPNEPGNVTHTARFVAEQRGVDYEALDALVERNAARVFGW
ncbi:MAG: TatD DNase family protein [Thermoleophilaceae bacterium]|nr:TatD DNase family protein [Thermoleophilaceae bacterium]